MPTQAAPGAEADKLRRPNVMILSPQASSSGNETTTERLYRTLPRSTASASAVGQPPTPLRSPPAVVGCLNVSTTSPEELLSQLQNESIDVMICLHAYRCGEVVLKASALYQQQRRKRCHKKKNKPPTAVTPEISPLPCGMILVFGGTDVHVMSSSRRCLTVMRALASLADCLVSFGPELATAAVQSLVCRRAERIGCVGQGAFAAGYAASEGACRPLPSGEASKLAALSAGAGLAQVPLPIDADNSSYLRSLRADLLLSQDSAPIDGQFRSCIEEALAALTSPVLQHRPFPLAEVPAERTSTTDQATDTVECVDGEDLDDVNIVLYRVDVRCGKYFRSAETVEDDIFSASGPSPDDESFAAILGSARPRQRRVWSSQLAIAIIPQSVLLPADMMQGPLRAFHDGPREEEQQSAGGAADNAAEQPMPSLTEESLEEAKRVIAALPMLPDGSSSRYFVLPASSRAIKCPRMLWGLFQSTCPDCSSTASVIDSICLLCRSRAVFSDDVLLILSGAGQKKDPIGDTEEADVFSAVVPPCDCANDRQDDLQMSFNVPSVVETIEACVHCSMGARLLRDCPLCTAMFGAALDDTGLPILCMHPPEDSPRIVVLPAVSRFALFYIMGSQLCRGVVSTSHAEGEPQVLLEASLLGARVFARSAPGAFDSVRDISGGGSFFGAQYGVPGYLFVDPKSFSEAVVKANSSTLPRRKDVHDAVVAAQHIPAPDPTPTDDFDAVLEGSRSSKQPKTVQNGNVMSGISAATLATTVSYLFRQPEREARAYAALVYMVHEQRHFRAQAANEL